MSDKGLQSHTKYDQLLQHIQFPWENIYVKLSFEVS